MKIITPNFPHKTESKTFCVLLKREKRMRKFSLSFHYQNMVESLWVPSSLRSKFTKRIDNENQYCHFAGRSFICKELSLNIFLHITTTCSKLKIASLKLQWPCCLLSSLYSYFLMIFILNPH